VALVKLEGLEKRKPDQIVRRPAAARTLARSRPVARRFCCSTAPAALDKKLRESTQLELMELSAKARTTFIIVTTTRRRR